MIKLFTLHHFGKVKVYPHFDPRSDMTSGPDMRKSCHDMVGNSVSFMVP